MSFQTPTFPTDAFVLVIMLFTKDGPDIEHAPFDNAHECALHEAQALTNMLNNKDVIGWKVLVDCEDVKPATRI